LGQSDKDIDMQPEGDDKQPALDRSAIHLLHRAGQCAGDMFTEEVVSSDLTPRQFAILLTISQKEGLSQTDMVERTGIDRSTLADIIRRMLKKGLIRRRRTKQDARIYAVKLTDAGRAALATAEPAAVQADARLLAALPEAKRSEFIDSLSVIVGAMTASNGKETA
jgi:DNA-binding MarR family transcriptional regulator